MVGSSLPLPVRMQNTLHNEITFPEITRIHFPAYLLVLKHVFRDSHKLVQHGQRCIQKLRILIIGLDLTV